MSGHDHCRHLTLTDCAARPPHLSRGRTTGLTIPTLSFCEREIARRDQRRIA